MIEATEQSNQLIPPEIVNVIKLKDFLQTFDETQKFYLRMLILKKT